jgi:hypothetical protein
MSEVSIGYPESPLNGPSLVNHVGPKPGERVVPIAGQTPIGSGSSPRFTLFAEPSAATSSLLASFGALLDPELRQPFQKDGLWLVRPDGYAACSATEAGVIANYLSRRLQVSNGGLPHDQT